jgi:hypothetical protein
LGTRVGLDFSVGAKESTSVKPLRPRKRERRIMGEVIG